MTLSFQPVPPEATLMVRDTCLCLHAQRAARALARRFDAELRPARLTNSQFSLLNGLNGPQPKTPGALARLLGADRTTITAGLKPLVREGLAEIVIDPVDRRIRRVRLTKEGHVRLSAALPLWRRAHAELEKAWSADHVEEIRHGLMDLAAAPSAEASSP